MRGSFDWKCILYLGNDVDQTDEEKQKFLDEIYGVLKHEKAEGDFRKKLEQRMSESSRNPLESRIFLASTDTPWHI